MVLQELTVHEPKEIQDMILEIGPGENGFVNSLCTADETVFHEKLLRNYEMARGLNMEAQLVPQTIYWLYIEGYPVGYGKLRHALNDNLLEHGGHIGYTIRPSCRNKGFGKLMLRELLRKANEINIEKVLLTCDESNIPSRRIIEASDGILAGIKEGTCKYWVSTLRKEEINT